MDEVELPQQARDARTGLRRLAPEIEAARDKIIEHFEDRPFAELKEFVQKLLETEEDEIKRLGALAARVFLLRKRIIDFEETIEFVPATEPLGELDVADNETTGKSWARVRVLENCEVNGMRLPEGIIVDVSASDAKRLIDGGYAELREAADPELSREDAVSEEDTVLEEDATSESAELSDADEDIQEETGQEIEAEAAKSADDTVKAETAADVETDADNEADVETDADNEADVETDAENEADVETDAENEADVETETQAAAESVGDVPESIDEASDETSNDADIELLDTKDHARATAIAETVEAFKELDEALASKNATKSAMSNNKNGESGEDDTGDKNEEADET